MVSVLSQERVLTLSVPSQGKSTDGECTILRESTDSECTIPEESSDSERIIPGERLTLSVPSHHKG